MTTEYIGKEFAESHGYSLNFTNGDRTAVTYSKDYTFLTIKKDPNGQVVGRLSLVWWLYSLSSDWFSLSVFPLFEGRILTAQGRLGLE